MAARCRRSSSPRRRISACTKSAISFCVRRVFFLERNTLKSSGAPITMINCSKIGEQHEVSVLTGAAPGLVGYDDLPALTQLTIDGPHMRLRAGDRNDPAAIGRLFVPSDRGTLVRLDNVVQLVPTRTASRIDRLDRQRQVSLRAGVAPGYAQADRLAAVLESFRLPEGPAAAALAASIGREAPRPSPAALSAGATPAATAAPTPAPAPAPPRAPAAAPPAGGQGVVEYF